MRVRVVGVLVGVVACVASVVTPAVAAPRPNILIILTDDQAKGTFSTMPDLRRYLIRGGVRFNKAHATTPLCCPSRGSIMTGRYVHNHPLKDNDRGRFLPEGSTIQRYLDDAGYRTGYFGKFLNGWPIDREPRFFDRFAFVQRGAHIDGTWNVQGDVRELPVFTTSYIRRRLTGFIRNSEAEDTRPWFAFAAPVAPHAPFLAQPRYEDLPVPAFHPDGSYFESDRSDKPPWIREKTATIAHARSVRRSQLRSLASVDDLIGATMRTLSDLGEARNTLIFFLSDNGFMWGQHELTKKRWAYLPSVEIPYLMRWPRRLDGGRSNGQLVANIDVAPTILDAAGVAPLEPMDGRSLLRRPERRRILLEMISSSEVHMPPWAAIRTHRYHYIEHYGERGGVIFREYYRLTTDPLEMRNVLRDGDPTNDPDVAALHRRLKAMRTCAPGACP